MRRGVAYRWTVDGRADDMVATGQKRGKRIFRDLSEIPERLRQAKR